MGLIYVAADWFIILKKNPKNNNNEEVVISQKNFKETKSRK